MKYYLSGPITGHPELNRPAFDTAAEDLTREGFEVLNPFDVAVNTPAEWGDCLRGDLAAMLQQCQGIILLPGWPQSKGSRLELSVALALDMPVLYYLPVFLEGKAGLVDMNIPRSV